MYHYNENHAWHKRIYKINSYDKKYDLIYLLINILYLVHPHITYGESMNES